MKFRDYIRENKNLKKLKPREVNQKNLPQYRAAQECIKNFLKSGSDGDIQSAVEDTAAANGWNAENFYEIVIKVAKKMGVENKI